MDLKESSALFLLLVHHVLVVFEEICCGCGSNADVRVSILMGRMHEVHALFHLSNLGKAKGMQECFSCFPGDGG